MVKLLQYWLTMKHIATTALIFLLTACTLTPCKVIALSAERWVAIKQRAEALKKQDAYLPKVGDNCFVAEDDVAWLTLSAKEVWQKKYNDEYFRMGGKLDFPGQNFKKSAVAASNGSLIFLEKGTKVKVLEGRPAREGYGFEGLNGKIEVLTGPIDGLTCFCDGGSLRDTVVESNETFFRTEEERKANQSLFVSEQLNKPIADVLAINGVRIDAPVARGIMAPTKPRISIRPVEQAETFGNSKYAFELQVPSGMFFPRRIEGDNSNSDDHFYLQSNDGDALIHAWGQPISRSITPELALKKEIISNSDWVCTFKKVGDHFFVVSGYVSGQIFYQKTILKGNHTINFIILVDKTKRKNYDSATEMLAQSLKATK